MSATHRKPWTQAAFLDWAEMQDIRHEFDGIAPVPIAGGTARHSRIRGNLFAALHQRLRGTPCSYFGPDLGIATIGNAIRFPDALITCTQFPGTERIAPDPVAVFEVLSPSTARIDRIVKVREYGAVASIQHYVLLETSSAALTHLARSGANWQAEVLAEGDTLTLGALGLVLPLAELFDGVVFDPAET